MGDLIITPDKINVALKVEGDIANVQRKFGIQLSDKELLTAGLHEESALPGMLVIADFVKNCDDDAKLERAWKLYTLLMRAVNVIQNEAGRDKKVKDTKKWLVKHLAEQKMMGCVMIDIRASGDTKIVLSDSLPDNDKRYGALSFSYGSSYCNAEVEIGNCKGNQLFHTSLFKAIEATRALGLYWLWTDFVNDLSIRAMQANILVKAGHEFPLVKEEARIPDYISEVLNEGLISDLPLPSDLPQDLSAAQKSGLSAQDTARGAFAFLLRDAYDKSTTLVSGGFDFIQMNYFNRGWIVQEYLAYRDKLRAEDITGGGFIGEIRELKKTTLGVVLAVAALQCTVSKGFASMEDMKVAMLSMGMFDMSVSNERGSKFKSIVDQAVNGNLLDSFQDFVEQARQLANHVTTGEIERKEVVRIIKMVMMSCAPDEASKKHLAAAKTTKLYSEVYEKLLCSQDSTIVSVTSAIQSEGNEIQIWELLILFPFLGVLPCIYHTWKNKSSLRLLAAHCVLTLLSLIGETYACIFAQKIFSYSDDGSEYYGALPISLFMRPVACIGPLFFRRFLSSRVGSSMPPAVSGSN